MLNENRTLPDKGEGPDEEKKARALTGSVKSPCDARRMERPLASVVEARGEGREPYWDNAKGALLILVVFGHLIGPPRAFEGLARAAYVFLYAWHMPAFAFVAGRLSRGRSGEDVLRPLAAYAVAQVIALAMLEPFHPYARPSLGLPYYHLWWFVALAGWRALRRTPLWTAVALSLAAAALPSIGADFALQRMFTLLPFFIVGLRAGGERTFALRPSGRLAAASALLWLAAMAWTLKDVLPLEVLWNERAPGSALWRAGFLVAGAVGTASFLALVPARETPLARIGRASLAVYALHPLMTIPLSWATGGRALTTAETVAALPVAAAIAWGLSLGAVDRNSKSALGWASESKGVA